MNEDTGEPEILSYQAFCNRQTLLAWHARRQAYEQQHGVVTGRTSQLRDDERFVYRGPERSSSPTRV
jgi:hypothetical protein